MIIREFKSSDAEKIIEVVNEATYKINSQDYSSSQIEALEPHDPDSIVNFAKSDEIYYIVAVKEDDVIGAGNIDLDGGEIKGIFVHPKHIREGVGTSLMEKLEDMAIRAGKEELKATSTVTAKKFYESQGFEIIEEKVQTINEIEFEVYDMKKQID